MFDPKKYDTRMRDPEGKRKKPSDAEDLHRNLPREARLRTRTEERFDEKRAEVPLPPREHEERTGAAPRTWWPLALLGYLALVFWRFAAGETGQGLMLLVFGGLGGVLLGVSRQRGRDHADAPPAGSRMPILRRPRMPRVLGRRRATAPAPPGSAPRRTRIRRPREKSSTLVVLGVLLSLSTFGGLIWRCARPARTPSVPHYERSGGPTPRASRDGTSHEVGPRSDWRGHLPQSAADRISGAVLFGGSQSVPHVRISMSTEKSSRKWSWTNDYGVFAFDGVRTAEALVEVRGAVDLGLRGPAVARLRPGTRDGRVVVDARHAFLLHLDRRAGRTSRETATLLVAGTDGPTHGKGRWELARACALVTGLARDDFYDVLVQAHGDDLAEIVERVAPGQEVSVSMRPAASVHGRLDLPWGAKPTEVEVVLVHGGLRVEAGVSRDGIWRAPCLPRGSWWDVTATRKNHPNARPAFRPMVHAGRGGMILLDLR